MPAGGFDELHGDVGRRERIAQGPGMLDADHPVVSTVVEEGRRAFGVNREDG